MNTARRRAALGLGTAALILPLTTIVSHTFGRSTYPLLLPAIKDDLLGSNTQAGFGGTAIYIAYLTGVAIVTVVAGRLEPMTIMRWGLFTSGVGLAMVSVAPNFALLMVGLMFASGGGAGIWITAPLLATEGVPPERRGVVIGVLTGSIGVATSIVALGTRLSRSAAENDDLWRPVFATEAVATAVILILVIALVRSRSTTRVGGRLSLDALRQLPHWKLITGAYVCFGGVAAGYSSFLAEALETDNGLSRSTVANVYIALGFSSMIGAPLTGWASDRWGRQRAMLLVLFGLAGGSAVIAFGSGSLVVVSVIAFGGMWSSYPTLTATYVRDHLDDRQFSSAYGTMTIFYGLVAIVPPTTSGAIADATGSFTVPYVIVATAAVLGGLILLRVPRDQPSTATSMWSGPFRGTDRPTSMLPGDGAPVIRALTHPEAERSME
ncbi:MAG: MFS transporter [Actinomycetota bacterium]|nr:MFS transporter [Actinomycetota bacterium]